MSVGNILKSVLARKIMTGEPLSLAVRREIQGRAVRAVAGSLGTLGRVIIKTAKSPEQSDTTREKIKPKTIRTEDPGEALSEHTIQVVTSLEKVQRTTSKGLSRVEKAAAVTGDAVSSGVEHLVEAIVRRESKTKTGTGGRMVNLPPRDALGRFMKRPVEKKKDEEGGLLSSALSAAPAALTMLKSGGLTRYLKTLGKVGLGVGGVISGVVEYQESKNIGRSIAAGGGTIAGGLAGAAVGQAVIPVPVLGALIGGIAGAWVGEEAFKRGFDWLSGSWGDLVGMFAKKEGKSDKLTATTSSEMKFEADRIRFEVDETLRFIERNQADGFAVSESSIDDRHMSLDKANAAAEGSSPEDNFATSARTGEGSSPENNFATSARTGEGGVVRGKRSPAIGGMTSSRSSVQGGDAQPSQFPRAENVDPNDPFGSLANVPRYRYQMERGERGEFNYSLSPEGWKEFGGNAGDKLVRLRTKKGLNYSVHKDVAMNIQGFVDELEKRNFDIRSIGGYANRNKVGGGGLSTHATGTTIDINPGANPFRGDYKTEMPPEIEDVANLYRLSWGKKFGDAMHFETMSKELWFKRLDALVKKGKITQQQAEAIKGGTPVQVALGRTKEQERQEKPVLQAEEVKKIEMENLTNALQNHPLGRRPTDALPVQKKVEKPDLSVPRPSPPPPTTPSSQPSKTTVAGQMQAREERDDNRARDQEKEPSFSQHLGVSYGNEAGAP